MSARDQKLFSYGTLKLPDVQRAIFGRLLDGAADELVGFSQSMVEIIDADVIAKSGARFHPIVQHTGNARDRVSGFVFSVTVEELQRADDYEVADYVRVEAILASGANAFVYASHKLG